MYLSYVRYWTLIACQEYLINFFSPRSSSPVVDHTQTPEACQTKRDFPPLSPSTSPKDYLLVWDFSRTSNCCYVKFIVFPFLAIQALLCPKFSFSVILEQNLQKKKNIYKILNLRSNEEKIIEKRILSWVARWYQSEKKRR